MHRAKLTEEQRTKVLSGLFHGTMVRAAHDSEDDLTWVYLNCKKFAAVIRSDGLVDVAFESEYAPAGYDRYERRDSHGSIAAEFWLTREEIKPYFQKYLPETYPEYVREKVDAILGAESRTERDFPGWWTVPLGIALGVTISMIVWAVLR